MGNEITVVHQVRQAMDKMRPELASVLPAHLSVERFVRITQTALQVNPDLQECTPRSIIAAATKCAEAGLQPDGEEGALVAYNVKVKRRGENGLMVESWEKQAKFLPMVRGIRNQVQRSGAVKDWKVRLVYSQDYFKHVDGDVEQLIHEPAYVDGDHIVKVYSIAYLENGELSRHVMRMEAVNKIRARSRSKESGPWVSDTGEMVKKTCLKQHSKALPKAKDDLERQRTQVMLQSLDDAEGVVDVGHQIAAPDAPRLSHHQVATQRLREAAEADTFDKIEDGEQFAPDNLPNPAPEAPKRTRAPRKSANERLAEAEGRAPSGLVDTSKNNTAQVSQHMGGRSGNGQPAPAAAVQQQAGPLSSTQAPAGRSDSHADTAEPSFDDDARDFEFEQQMSENPEPNGFRDAEPEPTAPHTRPEARAFSAGWDARFKGVTRVPPRTLDHAKDVQAWMNGYDSAQKTVNIGNQPQTPQASRIMCDNMISKLYP